jgi:hypothetical protein
MAIAAIHSRAPMIPVIHANLSTWASVSVPATSGLR